MDSHTPSSRRSTERSGSPRTTENNSRPVLSPFNDKDWHDMRHGMHCLMYSIMGAHRDVQDGQQGTRFAVWAPNARDVSIVCDANYWQHGQDHLHRIDEGIWTGFVR